MLSIGNWGGSTGSNSRYGKDVFKSSGNNIYGISGFGNLDKRLTTGAYQGTPWYQVTGANVQQKPGVQSYLDKRKAWDNMSWQEQVSKAHTAARPTNEEYVRSVNEVNRMPWEKQQLMKQFHNEQLKAKGRAWMAQNPNIGYGLNNDYVVGSMMANNQHIGNAIALNPFSGFGLPDGNQSGRILNMASHMGVKPDQWMQDYANQRDAFDDAIQGGRQRTMGPSIGLGSKMGLGGVGSGSFFRGLTSSSAYTGDYNPALHTGSNYTGLGPADTGRVHGPRMPNATDYRVRLGGGSGISNFNPFRQVAGPTYGRDSFADTAVDIANMLRNQTQRPLPEIDDSNELLDMIYGKKYGSAVPRSDWVDDGINVIDPSGKGYAQMPRPKYPSFNDFFTLPSDASGLENAFRGGGYGSSGDGGFSGSGGGSGGGSHKFVLPSRGDRIVPGMNDAFQQQISAGYTPRQTYLPFTQPNWNLMSGWFGLPYGINFGG